MRPPFSPEHLAPVIQAGDAVLRRTSRFRVDDPRGEVRRVLEGGPAIFVCCHGQLWPALWAVRGTGTRVLVSRSGDGELLARLLGSWGFSVSRGSSSKDGISGARDALRAVREGIAVGLAVDGPRGPRGVVQEGCLRLARRAGVPLVPLKATGGTWVLRRSWDHFEIPRPGGRLLLQVGPAIEVPAGPEGLVTARRQLSLFLGTDGAGHASMVPAVSTPGPRG